MPDTELSRVPLLCLLPRPRSSQSPIPADESIGRAVVSQARVIRGLELIANSQCEHLAQLDSPLVKRVDPPDGCLREDAVFVERHKRPQNLRRELVSKY